MICQDCGLVINDQYVDEGPEWRSYDMMQEDERSRTGPPMSEMIHDKGLSTDIDYSNTDSYGKPLSNRKRSQVYRLRKWQRRLRTSNATERNISYALSEINRISSIIGIPYNIRMEAAVIYKKAVKKNLIRGRSINSVVAAALYAACRKASVPRTLEEISEPTSLNRKEIGRTYRFLSRELNLKIKPVKSQEYIQRFCNQLELSGKVKKPAFDIIEKAEKMEILSGKGPTGLAAAAIYIASKKANEKVTQKQVAKVASVTEVTVRNRYKELVEKLNLDIHS